MSEEMSQTRWQFRILFSFHDLIILHRELGGTAPLLMLLDVDEDERRAFLLLAVHTCVEHLIKFITLGSHCILSLEIEIERVWLRMCSLLHRIVLGTCDALEWTWRLRRGMRMR